MTPPPPMICTGCEVAPPGRGLCFDMAGWVATRDELWCPQCYKNKQDASVRAAAGTIRWILLEVSYDRREDVLRQIDFCLHCGDDLRREDGSRSQCWCNVRTPS